MSELYWIRDIEPMRLAIMPRPDGGDALAGEISRLKQIGVDKVVCLLNDAEIEELLLTSEADLCRRNGIGYLSFPIPDRGIPHSTSKFMRLADDLAETVRAGQPVAIHCRAGIGRSSLTAGCTLLRLGIPAGEVFPMLSRARGFTVPDTPLQIEWFNTLTGLGTRSVP
jgi:protein tyrosine phosphatase (PTP) superfamily phosphohydrolase (DUF442 family)